MYFADTPGVNPSSGRGHLMEETWSWTTRCLQHRFAALTSPRGRRRIRARVPVRCAPALLRAVVPGSRLAGRVCPARHAGTVDAWLEAFEMAAPGDVLVVDNGGRLDEACVGDLVALEAQAAGVEGMVIWGLHRDTADIRAIWLSATMMACSSYPARRPRRSSRWPRRSAIPSGARPNGSGQVPHYAARYSSAPTLPSARTRLP